MQREKDLFEKVILENRETEQDLKQEIVRLQEQLEQKKVQSNGN